VETDANVQAACTGIVFVNQDVTSRCNRFHSKLGNTLDMSVILIVFH
jgi:hypothetical protein